MQLQTRLGALIPAPGGMEFPPFRAFKNSVRESDEPFRFVDGELIERFLDLTEEEQGRACEGLGRDIEGVRGLVEGLRRLH